MAAPAAFHERSLWNCPLNYNPAVAELLSSNSSFTSPIWTNPAPIDFSRVARCISPLSRLPKPPRPCSLTSNPTFLFPTTGNSALVCRQERLFQFNVSKVPELIHNSDSSPRPPSRRSPSRVFFTGPPSQEPPSNPPSRSPSFLNKGAIITEEDQVNHDGSSTNPWSLCTIQQAEEVKCILRVIPIWVSGIIYYTSQIILQNYVVFQALQSNRRLGATAFQIPAASYSFFTMLAVTLWLPIYDRAIVPVLRRVTGRESGISLLQKMGVGIVIATLAMALSAYVEHKRRVSLSSLSGFWLVPQLALAGLSEAFTMVGLVEFYYKQVSERMRSIGGSFLFTGMAISSYLGSFLESVVHRVSEDGGKGVSWLPEDLNVGRLDRFYGLIAGLEVVNLVYFLVCAKWYRYKGDGGVLVEKGSGGVVV